MTDEKEKLGSLAAIAKMKRFIPRSLSLHRKRRAWELHMKFYSHQEIADDLGMSLHAVTKMLCRLFAEFKQTFIHDVEQIQIEHIAHLKTIAREAMTAWEVSKKSIKKVKERKETVGGIVIGSIEHTNETEFQDNIDPDRKKKMQDPLKIAGNSQHLKIAIDALNQIRELTGAKAAMKHEFAFSDLTDAELLSKAQDILNEAPLD
jgi:hypothetical protein